MWFRRRRRRTHPDLSALDRLSELIERIVALLPEGAGPEAESTPEPAAEADTRAPEPPGLLFVPSSSGYRLVELERPPPAGRDVVELPEGVFRVLRLGPSPLPGDLRRCAFLEREEPPGGTRTSDG